jgi:hypothetical protein
VNRALHKINVLTKLLKDIRGGVNDEHSKRIDEIPKEFETGTLPLSL